VLLYLGAFLAGLAFLRADRFAEPALAAGALLVVLYGLSERLLPGLVDLDQSRTAGGRLEQPITYWNAMGAVAAMGLVLCTRMAADERRPAALRAGAAAAVAPLGAGIYLSFSRGAVAAVAAGLLVLVLLAPERAQLRAVAVSAATGLAAAVACGVFPWVRSFGDAGLSNGLQGAAALLLLVLLGCLASVATLRWTAAMHEDAGRPTRPLARGLAAAAVFVALILVTAAIEGSPEGGSPKAGAQTSRLTSLDSMRYEYWRVALETFAGQPLAGAGSGGFRVEWLRERPERDASVDAHSLYLETLAELGLAGGIALLVLLAGLALSARAALAVERPAVLGLVALLATYLVHAALDWDWELPAVTLPAIAAAAMIGGTLARERVQPKRLERRPSRGRRIGRGRGLPEPEPGLVVLGLLAHDLAHHADGLAIAARHHEELRLADPRRGVRVEAARVPQLAEPPLDLGGRGVRGEPALSLRDQAGGAQAGHQPQARDHGQHEERGSRRHA
jgi:hypothetical protein